MFTASCLHILTENDRQRMRVRVLDGVYQIPEGKWMLEEQNRDVSDRSDTAHGICYARQCCNAWLHDEMHG